MYYVNYGRGNEAIIGPFDDREVAQAYADLSVMATAVVVLRPPDPIKQQKAHDACKRTFYVDFDLERGSRVRLVECAPSAPAAVKQGYAKLPHGSFWIGTREV
jgi:hypothetical protein